MAEPVDAIMAFHNAFRNDMQRIDAAALDAARGKAGLAGTIERYRFFNEILVWHAHGEEQGVFPRIETVAPLVAEAYLKDHHGLDAAYEALHTAYAARDPLQTARATAAFRFHLDIHLGKEDSHLYRIFRQKVPQPEQGKAVGIMAGMIPKDRYPEVVTWLFPLIGLRDRENMIHIWQAMLPPPAFAQIKGLAQQSIGGEWAELVKRIPTLGET